MNVYCLSNQMACQHNRLKRTGFTLIEMLIALAMGAAIALLAYRALSGAINIEERVTEQAESLTGVNRVWQLLGDDLQHSVSRSWRDAFDKQQPAMQGLLGDRQAQSSAIATGNDSYLLQFVRTGQQNILNQARSNLTLVGYRLTLEENDTDDSEQQVDEDKGNLTLWRDYWRPIDSTEEPTISSRRVLDNIVSVQFRYLPQGVDSTKNENWIEGWPAPATAPSSLPLAVEVGIELNDLGKVVRLFRLVEEGQ